VGTTGVEADPTVRFTRVVHLRDEPAVQHETFRTDLGGVGVSAVQLTVDDPTITVSPIWKGREAKTSSPFS
jgi:hypothetical protein